MRFTVVITALVFTVAVYADPSDSFPLRKQQAIQASIKHEPAAEKLLRQLLKEHPTDTDVLFNLSLDLGDKGRQLKPGKARQSLMRESRQYCLEAKKLGFTDPLVATTLATINEDGSENGAKMSENPEVEQILRDAEEAYAHHQLDRAIRSYLAALAIQPSNYFATLNLGDAYFVGDHFPEAIEWFKKATVLDPNRETAYRYCGDALLRMGKKDDALDEYLSAIIAEPYNGYPWRGLQAGLRAFLIKPWQAAGKVPVGSISEGKKGVEVHLSEAGDALQVAYVIARAKWYDENHVTRFPQGTPYRQTLEEEVYGLETLATIYEESKSSQPADEKISAEVRQSMNELAEIKTAGLLEPHILFFRANKNIAMDYPAYRDKNREKLKAYLVKFYLHLP